MRDDLGKVADSVKAGLDQGARMRIATVTGVLGPAQVTLDISEDAPIPVDQDVRALKVGERVYAFQQGAVVVVSGRLQPVPFLELPIGGMGMFAGAALGLNTAWRICDGRLMLRDEYPELFNVIGTTFGAGDGVTNFELPNLTNRTARGDSTATVVGEEGGASSVTLTTAHLPSHAHSFTGTSHDHGQDPHSHPVRDTQIVASGTGVSVMGIFTGTDGADHATAAVTANNQASTATGTVGQSAGGGTAVPTWSPFLVVHYIIRVI
jgi:microcystin-dependent protein